MIEKLQLLIDRFIPSERKDAFKHYAKTKGLKFEHTASISHQEFALRNFKVIKSKNVWMLFKYIVTNDLHEINTRLRMYDYGQSGNNKSQTTTIIELKCDDLDIHKFHIRPIARLGRLKSIFADKRNNFFKNYRIDSINPESIPYDLGDESLSIVNTMKNITVEGENNFLLIYIKNKKIDIQDIDKYANFGLELLDSILYQEDNVDEFV